MTGMLQRLRRLLSPSEQLEVEDLKQQCRNSGATPMGECRDRAKVRIRGTVRWVTKLDNGGMEVLLTDGTGSVELNWTGRRRLECIQPGTSLIVEGRISTNEGQKVIYNPDFEVVG